VGSKIIDRTVRDVDVIEHVIKGVRTEQPPHDQASRAEFQSSRLGGEVLSHVSVRLIPDEEPDER
jgi:hypothetical protein